MNTRTIGCLCVGSIETNCWIYSLDDFTAVIDPGAEAPFIIEYLRKNNLPPQFILLTHGHFDHVTALPDLLKAYPAVTAIHSDDAAYLPAGADKLLADNDTIGPFKIIHVPGHTPGSVAFYDEEGGILFTGDTLFCGNCGRTDLPGGDQAKLEKSLEQLLSMKGNIRVLPGHGPESTIAEEASRGLSYFIGY